MVEPFLPKSVQCLRGYSARTLVADVVAGITVGLVALPLAMAFAISSGAPPQAGIYTAVVAGFLISVFGGSNVQIGGPATVVRNYQITGLTSHYAIPMLTGFELDFRCSDQHVKNVGARILDWSYQRPTPGSPGTLTYQVETMLTDKDKIPGMRDWVEVSVLGINRLGSN